MDLDSLFVAFGTDKGGPNGWGYSPAYEKHFGPIRGSVKNVLEIGICGFRDIPNNVVGASLFAWREYFPEATIHGLDNDGRFIFNDQHRIKTALCNAYDRVELVKALINFHLDGPLDFICDDAVHDPLPQIDLARMLWPLLRKGGIYSIEDVCPYKCPNNELLSMCSILIEMFPDMHIDEYRTHKAERLLILTKQ